MESWMAQTERVLALTITIKTVGERNYPRSLSAKQINTSKIMKTAFLLLSAILWSTAAQQHYMPKGCGGVELQNNSTEEVDFEIWNFTQRTDLWKEKSKDTTKISPIVNILMVHENILICNQLQLGPYCLVKTICKKYQSSSLNHTMVGYKFQHAGSNKESCNQTDKYYLQWNIRESWWPRFRGVRSCWGSENERKI